MVRLIKKELTDKKVSYYYKHSKDAEGGVITYYFDTKEFVVEKYCDEREKKCPFFTAPAKTQIRKYVRENNYPDEDCVMWY